MTMGTRTKTDADEVDGHRQKGSANRPQHINIKDDPNRNAPLTTVKSPTPAAVRLLAGGTAGFVESSVCHPLDTIKTRMQLQRAAVAATGAGPLGPFGTARHIVRHEGPSALYKGLTAVYCGIVPKMAIRFVSFEYYRDTLGGWHAEYFRDSRPALARKDSTILATAGAPVPAPASATPLVTFLAGLLAGLTEAVAIVTPAEVCKIRMQSQNNSLLSQSTAAGASAAPSNTVKYKNAVQTAALLVREEGVGALYKGVVPTMLRQGCNQAVNFTVYNWSKKQILGWKRERMQKREEEGGRVEGGEGEVQLDHWQSLLLGGFSGGMGPLVNNPLDVVKTRMQRQVHQPGKELKYKSLLQSCVTIAKEEGTAALWKGITPRLMRIMPGQAITFMTYEAVTAQLERNAFPLNLLIFNK